VTRTYQCAEPADRKAGIGAAVDAVRRGDLIVMPTDTLYGIGADAFTPTAVEALLSAKQRGRDMPVPVLVGTRRTLDGLVMAVPPAVHDLVDAFWPGPLTIVVEQAPSLAWDLGDADGTVAVRMPLHPVALEVLDATGPMAVSSANVSGQPPATTAEEAWDQLGWLVEVYLEAGSIGVPVASTIIDVTGEVPRVLRQGALDLATLRSVVPEALDIDGRGPDDDPVAAPVDEPAV
jgi:L-threonylcarbamoyladenylate synthase